MAGRSRRRSRWTPPTTPSTTCFAPTPSTASSSSRRCCRPTAARAASRRLVERFAGATMCSVGIELPGVPSLVLDNRPGMEAVVEHLVRDHGCRKIAFLAGTPENPEAKSPFRRLSGGAGPPRHRLRSGPDRPGLFPHQLGQGGDGGDSRARRGDRRRRGGERRDGDRRHRRPAQARPARAPGHSGDRLRRSACWRAWETRR